MTDAMTDACAKASMTDACAKASMTDACAKASMPSCGRHPVERCTFRVEMSLKIGSSEVPSATLCTPWTCLTSLLLGSHAASHVITVRSHMITVRSHSLLYWNLASKLTALPFSDGDE